MSGGESGLDTNFGGTELPGLPRAPHQLFFGEVVTLPAAVGAAEGAEAAALDADVGEVDVSIHHVSDRLPHGVAAQLIGRGHHGLEVRPHRTEERHDLVLGEIPGLQGPVQDGERSRRTPSSVCAQLFHSLPGSPARRRIQVRRHRSSIAKLVSGPVAGGVGFSAETLVQGRARESRTGAGSTRDRLESEPEAGSFAAPVVDSACPVEARRPRD